MLEVARVPRGKAPSRIEKWGGAECTVNRVGDRFRDQLALTGHGSRTDDIDRMIDLGVDAVRFPVLWERASSGGASHWSWSDCGLDRFRRAGVRPIVGLLHHGCGPSHTSLIDDQFAAGLAAHARRTAERYPWVTDWTPVNEPLTTARFAALYGLWYPHARDERLFWHALLNQIDATRLAMREIRAVQPRARLIQTEDLGRTYATATLCDQAAFDNQRRWMTWDLLCGRVNEEHPLWPRLCAFGFQDRLEAIAVDPCPPDVVGIDHYLTSDRLLDERSDHYPADRLGGNGWAQYCDVEAVRVLAPPPQGLGGAIREAWERYRLPIALTEIHNGCTREEQIRWLQEAWQVAEQERAAGVELCAVTAWALFGSSGWNTLLTAPGIYEPGAFDASISTPRPTALADAVRAGGQGPRHPVGGTGWWRRDVRLIHPATSRPAPMRDHHRPAPAAVRRPVLITGATGTLGRAIAAECDHRDIAHVLTGRDRLDLGDPDGIERMLDSLEPWAVINAAGWVRVDEAETAEDDCLAANATGAAVLARACRDRALHTINFSSDLVFAGRDQPYAEGDTPAPLNAYGRSKVAMEEQIAGFAGKHLVVRTAAFFSPFDPHNFAVHLLAALAAGQRFRAARDCAVSPTFVPDLCRAVLDLLIDGETGIWHLTNEETVDWASFALRLAERCGQTSKAIDPVSACELGWRARRPTRAGLVSRRGQLMPTLVSAEQRFAQQLAPTRAARAHLEGLHAA